MDNVVSSVCSIIATVVFVVVGGMLVDFLRSASATCDKATQAVKTVNDEFKPDGRINIILNNFVEATRHMAEASNNAANATAAVARLTPENAVYICARAVVGKPLDT